jgi:hypothetical protein
VQSRQTFLRALGDLALAKAQDVQERHVVCRIDQPDQLRAREPGLGGVRMTGRECRNRHRVVALPDPPPLLCEPWLRFRATGWCGIAGSALRLGGGGLVVECVEGNREPVALAAAIDLRARPNVGTVGAGRASDRDLRGLGHGGDRRRKHCRLWSGGCILHSRQQRHQYRDANAAHDSRECSEPGPLTARAALVPETAVVGSLLLRPSENVIRRKNLPELPLGILIARMQIGMTGFDGSAKRRSDLVVVGSPGHAKNVVVSLHLYPPTDDRCNRTGRCRPNAFRTRI